MEPRSAFVHLILGTWLENRFWDFLLPCSGERMAGFGEDLCVRRDPPGIAPRCCGCDYQEEASAPFICEVRVELEPADVPG